MNILYYPYINLPKTEWTIRALLYYDNVGAIVPTQYFHEPERFDPFMREVVRDELIIPVNPIWALDHHREVSGAFDEYLNTVRDFLDIRRRSFRKRELGAHHERLSLKKTSIRLHADKLNDDIFHTLTQMGLAERADDYWYSVERETANELMFFLTSVVANKIGYQPVTDKMEHSFSTYLRNEDMELRTRKYKRDLILKSLIPYPRQIDLTHLRQFKERHHDLLSAFSNKVEQIVLNTAIAPESALFATMLEDMKAAKNELTARMNESHLGDIVFGTVCGTVAAGLGFLAAPVVGAVPGLLHAIYSACRIERPEDAIDQTGLKYLALVDRRLRCPT